jgi:hypothetical protein
MSSIKEKSFFPYEFRRKNPIAQIIIKVRKKLETFRQGVHPIFVGNKKFINR